MVITGDGYRLEPHYWSCGYHDNVVFNCSLCDDNCVDKEFHLCSRCKKGWCKHCANHNMDDSDFLCDLTDVCKNCRNPGKSIDSKLFTLMCYECNDKGLYQCPTCHKNLCWYHGRKNAYNNIKNMWWNGECSYCIEQNNKLTLA